MSEHRASCLGVEQGKHPRRLDEERDTPRTAGNENSAVIGTRIKSLGKSVPKIMTCRPRGVSACRDATLLERGHALTVHHAMTIVMAQFVIQILFNSVCSAPCYPK